MLILNLSCGIFISKVDIKSTNTQRKETNMVNFEALNEAIKTANKSNEELAVACGLTLQGFLNKKNGKTEFTCSEATAVCHALGIQAAGKKCSIFLA